MNAAFKTVTVAGLIGLAVFHADDLSAIATKVFGVFSGAINIGANAGKGAK